MSKSVDENQISIIEENTRKLYNESIDQPTSEQRKCVSELRKLYQRYPTNTMAEYYAHGLFNLSLRLSFKEQKEIHTTLQNLYQSHQIEEIAECLGRIKYNLAIKQPLSSAELKQCANEIEQLYQLYKTERLAQPLSSLWYELFNSRAHNRMDYAQKILHLCQNISDPEANEAYAAVLFNPNVNIPNRDDLIKTFLSEEQTLRSVGRYFESKYYPSYNNVFSNIRLKKTYPVQALGKIANQHLQKFQTFTNSGEINAEALAVLFYVFLLKQFLAVPQIKTSIGHYTKLENIKYLVKPPQEAGKLRLYNSAYMNDPEEGKELLRFLSDKELNLLDLCKINDSNIYLSCFTTEIDNLPMWSMYGNDGNGCCLVFKKDFFDFSYDEWSDESLIGLSRLNSSNYLYRVCYLSSSTEELSIDRFPQDKPDLISDISNCLARLTFHIKELQKNQSNRNRNTIDSFLTFALDQIRYLFKDIAYEHEHELRLIKYSENPELDTESWIVPKLYIELPKSLEYQKVILGPKVLHSNQIKPYLFYTKKVKAVEQSEINFC